MKKIVVLGSNGQLGTDLMQVLSANNRFEVVGWTRKDLDVEVADFREQMKKLDGANVVINCISYHKTDEVEDFPEKAFQINSTFVYELAKLCGQKEITCFHISTDYVFDGAKGAPYLETDSVRPLNVYGISKVAGEFAMMKYCPKHFVFRVSSLFGRAGASGKGGNFVETMLKLGREGKDLKVISDQFMAPTHTLDIARAIGHFIVTDIAEYGVYHCCNAGSCSWYEFTKAIFELTHLGVSLGATTFAEYKTKAMRPQYSVMSNDRLARFYKMPDWNEALREYLIAKRGEM